MQCAKIHGNLGSVSVSDYIILKTVLDMVSVFAWK